MNKSQFIDALSERYDGNRKAASHALDSVLDTITRQVPRVRSRHHRLRVVRKGSAQCALGAEPADRGSHQDQEEGSAEVHRRRRPEERHLGSQEAPGGEEGDSSCTEGGGTGEGRSEEGNGHGEGRSEEGAPPRRHLRRRRPRRRLRPRSRPRRRPARRHLRRRLRPRSRPRRRHRPRSRPRRRLRPRSHPRRRLRPRRRPRRRHLPRRLPRRRHLPRSRLREKASSKK